MRHLTAEELLDVAEGTASTAAFPHLAACAVCERQLSDLRAALRLAVHDQVPEPPPHFWDHFQRRVRHRVAAAESPRIARFGRLSFTRWRVAAALAAAAVVVWAVAGLRPDREDPTGAPPVVAEITAPAPDVVVPPLEDDAALAALAEMTAELDWEAASEAGLLPPRGALDRVVLALDEEERMALGEILEAALAGKGA